MTMQVSIVVAVAANGVIGRDGGLPWRLPADLRFFKRVTMGHHLIMGRKTWASIGRPLPGRTMVVLTRDPSAAFPGAAVAHALPEALALARAAGDSEACVIGGAEVFAHALPLADRLYLTRVHADVEGDVYFPVPVHDDARGNGLGNSQGNSWLAEHRWVEVAREEHAADDQHAFAFDLCTFERGA
jgi:dihydrofolate reductase